MHIVFQDHVLKMTWLNFYDIQHMLYIKWRVEYFMVSF